MIAVRQSEDRGYFDHGWLQSFHSFSFANYHDPRFMGWGNLRVINEDVIAAGTGFGTHGHRDMEIVTYVISGALAHQDSMGNVESIPPGDVQRMSAGTGVQHSEFNHAEGQSTHLLQIWIEPSERGVEPGYEQISIDESRKRGALTLVASPFGHPSTEPHVQMHADALIYAGYFDGAEHAQLSLDPQRKGYLQVVKGQVRVNGVELKAGDALMLAQESSLDIREGQQSEVLFFDLAA